MFDMAMSLFADVEARHTQRWFCREPAALSLLVTD
jgi:hypothetical protein